ncbi:MAG: HD-GYP domain-containing protein [Dehalococcoidia bacterium]|nr:HD-GYP domain-containing protein [Dehalococcoidia bacterium]
MNRQNLAHHLLWLAICAAIVFWVADSIVYAFLANVTVIESLWPYNDPMALDMRLVIAGILVAFGAFAQSIVVARDQALGQLTEKSARIQAIMMGSVRAIGQLVEMKDFSMAGHPSRVAELATAIAKEIGLPEQQTTTVALAAIVHDIGKMGVPSEILNKLAPLSDIEIGLIKTHPQVGSDLLEPIGFIWPIAQIVLQHHESMDGSGYPNGIEGEDIAMEARIIGVADAVDVMVNPPPYRTPLSPDEALGEISRRRGVQFDAKVVDACLKVFAGKRFAFAPKGGNQ